MFAFSDARDYSFSKVPYLEREEEITDQSNFVNNVTQFYFTFPRPPKKMAYKRGKNSRKPRKLSNVETRIGESYQTTEQDIIALPPGLNVT